MGVAADSRKTRRSSAQARTSAAVSQNRGRASGKVEPKARLDCSPLTIWTRRSSRSRAEALFSIAPSWASTSAGPMRSWIASVITRTERLFANSVSPSTEIGRK
ncbi:MAG TPA: hypothetical protein VK746_02905, partial [Candidatus Eisenbacteria bacterium]|nr:hypothetical protein [Candidatus Eisenbacteria bacterium]